MDTNLIGVDIYDGENVVRWTMCERHFNEQRSDSNYIVAVNLSMQLDNVCGICELENG